MNIRSPIGLLATRLYKEKNGKKPDKFFLRQLEKELQALINAPTIEFTALPEQPMPCPPTELYEDEWTSNPEWRAERGLTQQTT